MRGVPPSEKKRVQEARREAGARPGAACLKTAAAKRRNELFLCGFAGAKEEKHTALTNPTKLLQNTRLKKKTKKQQTQTQRRLLRFVSHSGSWFRGAPSGGGQRPVGGGRGLRGSRAEGAQEPTPHPEGSRRDPQPPSGPQARRPRRTPTRARRPALRPAAALLSRHPRDGSPAGLLSSGTFPGQRSATAQRTREEQGGGRGRPDPRAARTAAAARASRTTPAGGRAPAARTAGARGVGGGLRVSTHLENDLAGGEGTASPPGGCRMCTSRRGSGGAGTRRGGGGRARSAAGPSVPTSRAAPPTSEAAGAAARGRPSGRGVERAARGPGRREARGPAGAGGRAHGRLAPLSRGSARGVCAGSRVSPLKPRAVPARRPARPSLRCPPPPGPSPAPPPPLPSPLLPPAARPWLARALTRPATRALRPRTLAGGVARPDCRPYLPSAGGRTRSTIGTPCQPRTPGGRVCGTVAPSGGPGGTRRGSRG